MGTLRIVFTQEDLFNTRVAAEADPLWEIMMSTNKIRTSLGGAAFDHWRRAVATSLSSTSTRRARAMIHGLVPTEGYFPDFLVPIEGHQGLESGITAIAQTPARQLDAELGIAAKSRSLPAWTRDLAAGSPSTLKALGEALRTYHQTFIAPYWTTIRAHVDADRALRARAYLEGGCEGVLASLRPAARWKSPVLECIYPVDGDIHLNGRGLTLIPSFFCRISCAAVIDPGYPCPVLVFPVNHDLTLVMAKSQEIRPPVARLSALIGRTRAQILTILSEAHTTGEIARRLELSAPTISVHTTTLREAGLIATRREGNTALHVLTAAGGTLCKSCGIS